MLKAKLFEDEQKYPQYRPSKDEVSKLDYVKKRFQEMYQARTIVDKDWDTYQTMVDAIFIPYPDERSSSVVPLASSLIELYVAETLKLQTDFQFKSETSEHATQAKALEYVWKYDWRKNNRKKPFVESEYIAAAFGHAVMYTGYESFNKEQYDPIIGDDMSLGWEKKTIDKSKIVVKNCDIRQFYIDNQALNSIDEASDCIYKQWISFEKFQNFKSNPLYKNLDKVTPKSYSNEYYTFVTQEEAIRSGDFVELMHYWNVEKDVYMVLANGVLIREHHMINTIDGEKALPFVVRVLGKKNYSIYGRGICEAALMFNSEVNNLRELLMDGIRRSNSQVLAIGKGLSFDGRSFSYDNEILTFGGDLGNNFQQISGNPPNQAIFSYLDRLYKDIAMYIGIDIQNIIGQAQQTAFQTEVQREASQKRINVWLMNRDLAYERFANLYKDLLQTYFPKKDAQGLFPKIEIEDEELRNGRFRKKKGNSMFEVTPEILRGDIYVDVYTNVSAPTINAVDRAQKLGFMNTLGQISQGYAMAQQAGVNLDSILPIKETIKDLADDYNLDPAQGPDNADVEEKKAQLMQEIQGMMGGGAGATNEPDMGGMGAEQQKPQAPNLPSNPQQGQNI